MKFFNVKLTSSVLNKLKVLWRLREFPAEDKIAHDIPCLVNLCLSTPEKKKFDQGLIIFV